LGSGIYKYRWISWLLPLLFSAIALTFTVLVLLTRNAPSSTQKQSRPSSSAKMPVRLVAPDDWRPLSMMDRRLMDLEKEGLLRPRTFSSRLEWIVPAVDHREPRPPKGYIVSFAKFHRHGLGSPPSRFMRALCHHFGVELQHFSPNPISAAAIFAAVCEGYLGMMPH